jgi:hypothetical protein
MNLRTRSALQASVFTAMLILLAFFIGVCAGVDKGRVQQQIGKAESAVSDARGSQARNYAPLQLKLAEEKLAQARIAFENEDYQSASWLAEEAVADANLAEAKSQWASTRQTVQQLQDTIQSLQQEIHRKQTQ